MKNPFFKFYRKIQSAGEFYEHTKKQREKLIFSSVHAPFMTENQLLIDFFYQHFSEFQHLFPTSLQLKNQSKIQTPITIKPLKHCPIEKTTLSMQPIVCIGGAPALLPAAFAAMHEQNVVYICDTQQINIASGSAYHLIPDVVTSKPAFAAGYTPLSFMLEQISHILIPRNIKKVAETGFFSWQSLDWFSWLMHPEQWWAGIKIAFNFKNDRWKSESQTLINNLAEKCQISAKFYQELNQILNNQLLSAQHSIIVARNVEELKKLRELEIELKQEQKLLEYLSAESIKSLLGFVPEGVAFAQKNYDAVLNPNFQFLIEQYIQKKNGKVIHAVVNTIYIDDNQPGGIVEYTLNNEKHYIEFSQLVLSAGKQAVVDEKQKPLYDLISANGISILAFADLLPGTQLHISTLCGGTNNITRLSTEPIPIIKNNIHYQRYLVRMTAGACIAPRFLGERNFYYDSVMAVGLMQAVKKTLRCEIEPLVVRGCPRMVNHTGEMQWMQAKPGLWIQYGAAGGGLTRAAEILPELKMRAREDSNL